MKTSMKLVTAVITVILAMSFGIGSLAANESSVSFEYNYTSVNGTTTLEIPVTVSENTGFMCFAFTITYDPCTLINASVTKGDMLAGGVIGDNLFSGELGTIKVVYRGCSDVTENGKLFTLNFDIAPEAIGSSNIQLNCVQEETLNISGECAPMKIHGCVGIETLSDFEWPEEATTEVATTEATTTEVAATTHLPITWNYTTEYSTTQDYTTTYPTTTQVYITVAPTTTTTAPTTVEEPIETTESFAQRIDTWLSSMPIALSTVLRFILTPLVWLVSHFE